MVKIIGIETSTHACSAALYIDGHVNEYFQIAPRLHGELILPMINDLLIENHLKIKDIDAIAYGCGPGSFTGVRMAASLVQGLAFGMQKPVIPISSLLAMADKCYQQLGYTHLACAFDARMNEVYWGAYHFNEGGWKIAVPECVIAPANIPVLPSADWIGVGEGWHSYPKELSLATHISSFYPRAYPHASSIASLAYLKYLKNQYISPQEAFPTYLRNKVVN